MVKLQAAVRPCPPLLPKTFQRPQINFDPRCRQRAEGPALRWVRLIGGPRLLNRSIAIFAAGKEVVRLELEMQTCMRAKGASPLVQRSRPSIYMACQSAPGARDAAECIYAAVEPTRLGVLMAKARCHCPMRWHASELVRCREVLPVTGPVALQAVQFVSYSVQCQWCQYRTPPPPRRLRETKEEGSIRPRPVTSFQIRASARSHGR